MGKFLKSKRPINDSELGFFFQEVYDAIEFRLPIVNAPGRVTVDRTGHGQRLNFEPGGGSSGGSEVELRDCVTGRTYIVVGRIKSDGDE